MASELLMKVDIEGACWGDNAFGGMMLLGGLFGGEQVEPRGLPMVLDGIEEWGEIGDIVL